MLLEVSGKEFRPNEIGFGRGLNFLLSPSTHGLSLQGWNASIENKDWPHPVMKQFTNSVKESKEMRIGQRIPILVSITFDRLMKPNGHICRKYTNQFIPLPIEPMDIS